MSREAFEAWYAKNHRGVISSTPKEDAQQVWQAAQADAYERAEKVCRDQWYAADCADAIRALAKEPTR